MEYKKDDALFNQLNSDLGDLMYLVGERVQELLVKNIYEIVYEPYRPAVYQRKENDGGFISSWTQQFYENKGNLGVQIYSDPELMFFDPNAEPPLNYVHGRPGDDGQTTGLFGEELDRRPYIDQHIAEGTGWDFSTSARANETDEERDFRRENEWWKKPRDYFTPTIDYIKQTNLLEYISVSATQMGIKIIKK